MMAALGNRLETTAFEICCFLERHFPEARRQQVEDFRVIRLSSLGAILENSLSFATKCPADLVDRPKTCLLIVSKELEDLFHGPCLAVDNPRLAYAFAAKHFLLEPTNGSSIHPTAQIDPEAIIAADVSIGAYCVVSAGSSIGSGTRIAHGVVVGSDVSIGRDCRIGSGTVIGEIGFGVEEFGDCETVRLPHVGGVRIGDRVEIGALNSIVAGTIDPTIIEDGVQTDNLVHIAHNCQIGRAVLLTACAELSGSVTLGERVWVGPNASIMNGVELGKDCLVGLGTVVRKSSPGNRILAGAPAKDLGSRR